MDALRLKFFASKRANRSQSSGASRSEVLRPEVHGVVHLDTAVGRDDLLGKRTVELDVYDSLEVRAVVEPPPMSSGVRRQPRLDQNRSTESGSTPG